jgi:hypothetical protein
VRLTADEIAESASQMAGVTLSLTVNGSQARLTHPHGQSVSFDLTRSDLELPIETFSQRILTPALKRLKEG